MGICMLETRGVSSPPPAANLPHTGSICLFCPVHVLLPEAKKKEKSNVQQSRVYFLIQHFRLNRKAIRIVPQRSSLWLHSSSGWFKLKHNKIILLSSGLASVCVCGNVVSAGDELTAEARTTGSLAHLCSPLRMSCFSFSLLLSQNSGNYLLHSARLLSHRRTRHCV